MPDNSGIIFGINAGEGMVDMDGQITTVHPPGATFGGAFHNNDLGELEHESAGWFVNPDGDQAFVARRE